MTLSLTYSPEVWPIASAMIHRRNELADGRTVQDQSPDEWAEALAEVAAAGFAHLDPTDSWIRLADLTRSRRDEFMAVCRQLGLSIPAISTARKNLIDAEQGAQYVEYGHRLIDTAAEIGAGAVSFGFFGLLSEAQRRALWFWTAPGVVNPNDPVAWKTAVERVRELGRHAGENGLELALEMYEDTYLGTADSAVRFCQDVDLPNVRINCDLGNLVRLHRPVEHWQSMMEKLAPFAGYWHAKNYYRMEDETTGAVMSSPAPMEFGVINYREAIRMALKAGFKSAFLLEHYGGDGLSVCAVNRDYIRRILRAVSVTA
ncbi:sugar phosphate isomerase/epimerase [Aureimonas altamirensis]|uniref:sugar phosphate isomerase/epimerase family protein n=1 Tax=Aureimonas altamirensis TaxID=370622 RepID=UPI001E44BF43|nr:sugar phosphate isomerase/epimerase family protein [Aureimonas altamirensis]UHD46385.1 sugar phosphate isomerase/epimerase [Aureimonas altamirensis]